MANCTSLCFSASFRISALRTSGSPPVSMYRYTPSSLPWVMILSISSKLRLFLWPYSPAQQPTQCMLQALVGSNRISQGMLHWYLTRFSRMVLVPRKNASYPRLRAVVRATLGLVWSSTQLMSLDHLLSGLSSTRRAWS